MYCMEFDCVTQGTRKLWQNENTQNKTSNLTKLRSYISEYIISQVQQHFESVVLTLAMTSVVVAKEVKLHGIKASSYL